MNGINPVRGWPALSNSNISVACVIQQVSQAETDLKIKANAYNTLKSNLQSFERKAT